MWLNAPAEPRERSRVFVDAGLILQTLEVMS